MRETSSEKFQTNGTNGELAITASSREGRRIVLDIEDVRRRCEAIYAAWEKKGETVPKFELSAEQTELIREKMEKRGFDTLVWVQSRAKLPGARKIIEKTLVERDRVPPEFFGRMTVKNIDELKETRPEEPYLLLTKGGGAESWSLGKSPEEIGRLLERLGEKGLTLREYLLIENLAADEVQKPRAGRLQVIGEYLLDSSLSDGGIVAVSRGAAGDLSITSAQAALKHPTFGARGATIIPLPKNPAKAA